ncbi:bifunctional protein FolD protein [Anaerotignum neopropionicum]|uniref:Bifunctional protein FolD n=2 Tax=Anaerotignum neopropionicum TaxID=36847 RepID=A0A136WDX1_9FIRM|nr:tetrahydrofolate dehydrogenase/cyclohydrolase catalytic domain-containing protein [Anaerotignum neopropionicum]KXL52673.1 bifunctional protein FolD protein [Anaerotignum neopropionicum]
MMTAQLIDGKLISAQIKEEAAKEAAQIKAKGVNPCLVVVLVGNDSASQVYVNNKKKACEAVGIRSVSYELGADTTEEELLHLVAQLNADEAVHGILVQMPLPMQINEEKVILAIDAKKDVDCFHPMNVGLLHTGGNGFLPCTPAGIIELIKRSGHTIQGQNCVIIGRSNIVGKPVAMLLMQENGTVTICHSKTRNLAEVCLGADIIVSATGKVNTVTADMVKAGAVVIDVGMNRNEAGKLCGDVDFDKVKEIAGAITPVPGGVGPMTIAMLMKNCLVAAKMQNNLM